jgi:hypothetical protein
MDTMTNFGSDFVMAGSVRRALVGPGDIRAEIEFQNDINGLLARLDEGTTPLEALAPPSQPVLAGHVIPRGAMRIIRGGAMPRAHSFDDQPIYLQAVARGA